MARWAWYDENILPKGIEDTCATPAFEGQRRRVVPSARGRVLEVGSGSGLNLPYYDRDHVERVFALDPMPAMHALAGPRYDASPVPVEPLVAPAERVPLEDASVDTVLVTYTLCSVDRPEVALEELRRVLRPGGRMLFVEHGLAPEASVRFWQRVCNPLWAFFSGGCQLTRDFPAILEAGPWRLEALEREYIPGWRPLNFNFRGAAVPR
jgi:SAM-dependent methyltransferase